MSRKNDELWPALNSDPFGLLWRVGCLASGLVLVVALLVVSVLITLFEVSSWWLLVGPVMAWVAFLGLPGVFVSRRVTLGILEALASTVDTWRYRADVEADLYDVEVREVVRPVVVNEGARLLASNAAVLPAVEVEQSELWELPNGRQVSESVVRDFAAGVFNLGLSRSAWVPERLERQEYEGLLAMFCKLGAVRDRKPGFPGRLAVASVDDILQALGIDDHASGAGSTD